MKLLVHKECAFGEFLIHITKLYFRKIVPIYIFLSGVWACHFHVFSLIFANLISKNSMWLISFLWSLIRSNWYSVCLLVHLHFSFMKYLCQCWSVKSYCHLNNYASLTVTLPLTNMFTLSFDLRSFLSLSYAYVLSSSFYSDYSKISLLVNGRAELWEQIISLWILFVNLKC